jgi:CHAT domain-containing protein/Tfp pilus assembly protein PilF
LSFHKDKETYITIRDAQTGAHQTAKLRRSMAFCGIERGLLPVDFKLCHYPARSQIAEQRLWLYTVLPAMIPAGLACVLLLLTGPLGQSELIPGVTLQGSIRSGEAQSFFVRMVRGKVAEVLIEQAGTDLQARVVPPTGESFEVDTRESGPEPFVIKGETSGLYRVEVETVQKRPQAVSFQIKLGSLRETGPDADLRMVAQQNATLAKRADTQRSSDKLRAGVAAARDALKAWHTLSDRTAEAAELSELATLHIYLGDMEEARDELLEALAMARENMSPWTEAEALTNLGHVLWRLRLLQESREKLEQAIRLWRTLGNQYAEAAALNNLGNMQSSMGEYQQAMRSYKQSREIAVSLGDRDHEGFSDTNLAAIYEKLAMDPAVIESDRRAMAHFRSAKDSDAEAWTTFSLAGFYLRHHRLRKARALGEQARLLSERIRNDVRAGESWKRLGDISSQLHEYARARREYQQALADYRRAALPAGEADVQVSLGKLGTAEGDYSSAKDHLDKALTTFRSLGRQSGEATALQAMGELNRSCGNYEFAIANLEEAVAILSRMGTPAEEAFALFNLASIERDAGRLDDAVEHSRRVLDVAESLRALVGGPQLRISFLASIRQYYQFAQDLYMQLEREHPGKGFAAQALEVVERSHARALLDSIDEASLNVEKRVDDNLAARQKHLQEELNFWSERLTDASAKSDAARHKEAAGKLEALLAKYHELESEMRDADPQYAMLTPRLLHVPDIQKEVLDPQTVLLEYALGEPSSHLWVLTPDSLEVFELPGRNFIEALLARSFPQMKQGNTNSSGHGRDAMISRATLRLSRILLYPAAARIRGKRIVIAGDSLIGRVPFAGLPSPESPAPLISHHELVFLPSASLLAEQRRLALHGTPPGKTLAVIADPVFDSADVRAGYAGSSRPPRFARLPFTRAEARAILSVAPKHEALAAFDFDADRDLFTSKRLTQYRIVHIATHAVIDPERPELSSLVFSQIDRRGKPRDGYLRLYEIASLRLRAKLVTLSACGTALGRPVPGEGTVGLAWAFLHAGAKTVVVSLWDVDDQSTAELMRLFYQNLLGPAHLRPAAALRQAQLSMLRRGALSADHWSAWTVIGDWN